jgi:hypothetical protein
MNRVQKIASIFSCFAHDPDPANLSYRLEPVPTCQRSRTRQRILVEIYQPRLILRVIRINEAVLNSFHNVTLALRGEGEIGAYDPSFVFSSSAASYRPLRARQKLGVMASTVDRLNSPAATP